MDECMINLLFSKRSYSHVQFIPNTLVAACTRGKGNPGYTTYMYILGLVRPDCKGGCREQGWDLCICILPGLRRLTLMISYQAGLDCPAINNLHGVQLYTGLLYTQWHVIDSRKNRKAGLLSHCWRGQSKVHHAK